MDLAEKLLNVRRHRNRAALIGTTIKTLLDGGGNLILRTIFCGVFGLLAVLGMNCSSERVNRSAQEDSPSAVSGENMVTLDSVADLWQEYEASTNTTCIEALKIAIGESGLTGNPDPAGQIPCTGKCINASAVNSFGATGIWQVKCPESSSVLIYNAFQANGLIDETGQCADLRIPAHNALAASLHITISCPYYEQSGFCKHDWTGDQNHPDIAGGYYNQFTLAATTACAN